jgi:DNA helicase HerA-like ATPase
MNPAVLAAAKKAFPPSADSIVLGAVVHEGECNPEPIVHIPVGMMNRHGLIAGATGTGKTKSLQLIAEQLAAHGIPVFMADLKGDLSGVGVAGQSDDKITQRAKDTGYQWHGASFSVEFLSLTGARGAQLRATVSSFGQLLLS